MKLTFIQWLAYLKALRWLQDNKHKPIYVLKHAAHQIAITSAIWNIQNSMPKELILKFKTKK